MLLSLVTLTLWGSLPLALKAVTGKMNPVTLTWYRYLVSVAVLTPYVFSKGIVPRPSVLTGRIWLLFAICLLGFVGNNVAYLIGLTYVAPSAAQVVIQLAPLLLMLGAVFVFHESFTRLQWSGVALLVIGMLLFFHRQLGGIQGSEFLGVAWILLAACLWAAYAMAQKVLLKQFPSMAIMWVNYTGGALLLAAFTTPGEIAALDLTMLLFLAYCCINSLIAYGAFAEAMAHWDASRVSAVVANAPLLTILFTAIVSIFLPDYVKPDHLPLLSIVGAIAVVAGSVTAAGARFR